ncbi:MAG: hypothetical protein II777_01100 [Clostridia bacterium]|nr:hypothetical protein [Clostridia bacterium]
MKKKIFPVILAALCLCFSIGCDQKPAPAADDTAASVSAEKTSDTGKETEKPDVTEEPAPKLPDYYIDFRNADNVYAVTGQYHVAVEPTEKGMLVKFIPSGDKASDPDYCFDPYMTLPLPDGKFSVDDYPYFVIALNTSRNDMKGDIRYRTDKLKSGNSYPTDRFTYKKTGDQIIVLDLTDSDVLFIDPSDKPVSGNYTDLRMDMFENSASANDHFEIYWYAFFDSYGDACDFEGLPEPEKEPEKEKPDLSAYPLGAEFADPPFAYRPRKLLYGFDAGYEYKLRSLIASGYGGVVSNVNFTDKYLKDDKEFALLKDVYEAADKLNMKCWIYDEYQWPSGKAFGQVLAGHPEYEATGVEMIKVTGKGDIDYKLPDNYIGIIGATLVGNGGAVGIKTEEKSVKLQNGGDYTLYVYARRITNQKKENPGDFTTLRDVDLLNPDAVRRFIDTTYEKYKDKFGDTFSIVEAFFTDEPQLGNRDMNNYVVWSDKLPERFRKTYGYEITDHLYSLFSGNTEEDKLVRINFYQTVSDMFCEAYFKQLSDWCEAHGTAFSGHMLFEENMQRQIETYGGDFMHLVGTMTIPGADILHVEPDALMNETTDIGNFMCLKYVSGAAKNAGKNKVHLEFNPGAVSNAKFFNNQLRYGTGGATLSTFFGATDFSVILGDSQMKVKDLKALNEYIGRINVLLENAVTTTDIAVFYPIDSARAGYIPDGKQFDWHGTSGAAQVNAYLVNTCKSLLNGGLDFTLIDRQTIGNAAVESANGKATVAAGLGRYSVIVMPDVTAVDCETLDMLLSFKLGGGKIIWLGSVPSVCTDRRLNEEFKMLVGKLDPQIFKGDLIKELKNGYNSKISVKAPEGVFVSEYYRTDIDKTVYYIASSKVKTNAVTVTLDGEYLIYDPYEIKVTKASGATELTLAGYHGIIIMK